MITKEIIETIISIDPYQRERFRSIGLLDHADKHGAPSDRGAAVSALMSYAALFKKRHLLILKLDNGTLITYLIIALHERDKSTDKYEPRKKVPVLVIKGRVTILIEENIPSLSVLVKKEMSGNNDTAWMRDGIIQFLEVLPITRNTEPDTFARYRAAITLNMEFGRPFDFEKNKIKIAQWRPLVNGLLRSQYSK